jgi:hypothetical protein
MRTDLRLALRMLFKQPGFMLIAVLRGPFRYNPPRMITCSLMRMVPIVVAVALSATLTAQTPARHDLGRVGDSFGQSRSCVLISRNIPRQ